MVAYVFVVALITI